jgi:hypothetical protein
VFELVPIPYRVIHPSLEQHMGHLKIMWCKTKYMLLPRHQHAGQNHDIKIADRCFENVAQLRYLGTAITNQNLTQEKIKRRLNSGNQEPFVFSSAV